jgi:hypothetical protein
MNIKKLVQFGFQTLIVISLLFTNVANVVAQGEDDGGYIGEVSVSQSKSLPPPKAGKPGIQPLASQPLPGGGTATATAQLAWNQSLMDGIARSSLSSSAVGNYYICARVEELYMNGVPQGGTGNNCGTRGPGGSITAKKSKAVVSVFGKTWQVNTRHSFQKQGWGGWYPSGQAGPISL